MILVVFDLMDYVKFWDIIYLNIKYYVKLVRIS